MKDTALNHASPSKFYNHFLFKALLVVLFLVAVQLLPSEIISQYLHTGPWELLQLIFVGIAVSYGLFSSNRKSDDDEIENEYYHNNAQSCVSRSLQASSFFDDEAENRDENKVQTWSNQYHSVKPVAQESVLVKHRAVSSRIVEKPLLLPVRSLKPAVPPIPPPPPPPRPPIPKESSVLKSSFTVPDDRADSDKELRKCIRSVPMELTYTEKWKRPRKANERLYTGKSVRTIRPFVGAARARVYAKDFVNEKEEKRKEEVEGTFVDKLMEFTGEEKKESVERELEETHEDSEFENEEDCVEESSGNEEIPSESVSGVAADQSGPDVDKKADEFIAKFREQIRFQRVRRSAS